MSDTKGKNTSLLSPFFEAVSHIVRGKLIWQLWLTYLIVAFFSLIPLGWYLFIDWRDARNPIEQSTMLPPLGIIAFSTVLLASGISFIMAFRILRPLNRIRRGAERFARGELGIRIYPSRTKEVAQLAESLNSMAAQLEERLDTVVRQQNEQRLILSSMTESLIAVGRDKKIIRMNTSACEFFNVPISSAVGRTVEEVIYFSELQKFALEALSTLTPMERTINISGQSERIIEAYARILHDPDKEPEGVLLVFQDITRIRKLERVRKDFVANVSHELKTPVTNIKGFVETLIGGAKDNPDDLERFLKILATNADRLDSIIDDLLILARLEQDEEAGEIETADVSIKEVLIAASDAKSLLAKEKNIKLEVDCSPSLRGNISRSLIEQAIVNLIGNALNYSGQGTKVQVRAEISGDELIISVKDRGVGIDTAHLPRLFERFYRVDKARSRKEGGTGLGLAIVKHIAQLHGGYPTVVSAPGRGSTFAIHIPRGT